MGWIIKTYEEQNTIKLIENINTYAPVESIFQLDCQLQGYGSQIYLEGSY